MECQSRRLRRLAAQVVVCLVIVSCGDSATINGGQVARHFEPEYETFHDLGSMTAEADLIVVASGRQVRVETLPGDAAVFTVSELTITEVIKGQPPAESLELWQLGTDDSNMASTLVGKSSFLLFLVYYAPPALGASDSRVTPVGGTQGVYRESDSGRFVIVGEGRPTSNPTALTLEPGSGTVTPAP